ncbi:hypothetical protein [Desulfosporosinus sp. BICA1-9]|uniref:hypothetical protein n=1 Tax=Desulfosporosinus sp. BICA1-9 TaxID=1531958 RepID=UPI00054BEA26|nr:hypothetical protein [Desulfosporosinus sp. BICA1-9]KJS50643.1 MAG: hypothetical protein VR66_01675 [Peptococcaceae bacterium BRH_c23]KJS88837.1 MAG: hypothetical protein JL57_10450 [Desulfosporosinus sp. BICA1-9]HBW37736.1 hypothetical protein [Desulfosporosinus sp.]
MSHFSSLTSIFGTTINSTVSESFHELKIEMSFNDFRVPEIKILNAFIESIPSRDTLILNFILDDGDPINFSPGLVLSEFLIEIQDALIYKENGSKVNLILTIVKNSNKENVNVITIYSLDELTRNLLNQSLLGVMHLFSQVMINNSCVYFMMYEQTDDFHSATFYFLHEINDINESSCDRSRILKKRNDVCNFLNASQYDLLPEDFHLITRSSNQALNGLMDKMANIFSLIFISDISSFERDTQKIRIKVNGYKSIENELIYSEISPDGEKEYFDLYSWVYNEGNINDKIGLARNILSIHVPNDNLLCVRKGLLSSVQSAYKIYLKDNVEQYVAVKNKVNEFLFELSSKIMKKADTFVDTFKKNFIGLFTFFLIVFLRSILISSDNPVFTKEVTYIELIFLGVSLLYLLMSIWEAHVDLKKVEKDYKRLEERYDDLLVPEDIQIIFNDGKDCAEDVESAKKKIIAYSIIWFLTLMLNYIVLCEIGQF